MKWISHKLRWLCWFLFEQPHWTEWNSGENYKIAMKRWQEKEPKL